MVNPSKEELNQAILKYFRHTSKKKCETERSDFVQVSSISLAAISLIVLVRKEYLAELSDIKTDTISFGFGNFLPNKGAVSVSFKIGFKKVLFINCHLDAHIENRVRRAEQFLQIKDQMVDGVQSDGYFCQSKNSVRVDVPTRIGTTPLPPRNSWDAVVWVGDFNSRV